MTQGVRAGTFAKTPLGCILHGTRSGQPYTVDQEYDATVRFVAGGAGGLGWNATVGNGKIDKHLSPGEWGWNAREHSAAYLAVELAQARLGDAITDAQVQTFARYFVEDLRPWWPNLPLVFPEHYELPAGQRDGKTDCDPAHPGQLAARVKAAIAAIDKPTSSTREADLTTALAYVADDLGDQLESLAQELRHGEDFASTIAEIRRVRKQFIGPRA